MRVFFFYNWGGGRVVVIRVSRREGLLIQAFSPSCVRLAHNVTYSHFQVALVLYNQAGNRNRVPLGKSMMVRVRGTEIFF